MGLEEQDIIPDIIFASRNTFVLLKGMRECAYVPCLIPHVTAGVISRKVTNETIVTSNIMLNVKMELYSISLWLVDIFFSLKVRHLKEIYEHFPTSLAYVLARTEMACEYIVVYCKSDVANTRTMLSRFIITYRSRLTLVNTYLPYLKVRKTGISVTVTIICSDKIIFRAEVTKQRVA